MQLCGLDFETANPCSGSICAVGVAVIENGVVIKQQEHLIKPHKSIDFMNQKCQEVHGISYEDLRESPEFYEVWQGIRESLISADYVVIHNALFDLRHLRKVLELYNLSSTSFNYLCSVKLCRYHFPELDTYGLSAMAEKFNIEFRHHDALEDAETCAKIASQLEIPKNLICRFDFIAN